MSDRQSPARAVTALDRAEAEAAAWLGKLNAGPLGPEDARLFNAWLRESPEHERLFRRGQDAMRYASLLRGAEDFERLKQPSLIEQLGGALQDSRAWFGARMRAGGLVFGGAGALAAAAAAAFLVLGLPDTSSGDLPPAEIIAAPLHATRVAEIREITLPDGSFITLGAASGLDVAFSDQERRIILRGGEAFFDVAPDPDRPFIVVADNTIVRVVGTKFDVNLGAEVVDIAVLEGRVEVIRPERPEPVLRDSDIRHVLTAGQRVAALKQGPVQPVRKVEADSVAAWRTGRLVWVDTPVSEILADLNRYSEAPILLAAPGVADMEFTLAVQSADADRTLRLLADTLGLEVVTEPDGRRVLR